MSCLFFLNLQLLVLGAAWPEQPASLARAAAICSLRSGRGGCARDEAAQRAILHLHNSSSRLTDPMQRSQTRCQAALS